MYLPAHFAETRAAVLQSLMAQHPLATVVTLGAAGLTANHLPLHFEPVPGASDGAVIGRLVGHVARANPVHQDFDVRQGVLAIFQGPSAYVSPNWYPTKQVHGKVVPTWNYAVVHARGRLMIRDDPVWVHALVSSLTRTHEARFEKPWAVTDAPEDYIARLTAAIVGIEIEVTHLEGKWKVSQNQPVENRSGAAAGLAALDTEAARAMAALVVPAPADGA